MSQNTHQQMVLEKLYINVQKSEAGLLPYSMYKN